MFPRLSATSIGWEDQSHLIEELRAGDPSAHRWIAEAYRQSLLAFAQKILGDGGDAEDIVQEALARIWAHRKTLRADGSIRALLFARVRSLCLDEHRRAKRRQRLKWGSELYSVPTSPLEELLGLELERMAEDAVHALPPRRKAIFQMVREGGLSHKETADALGVSPQTVANTMSSALAQIRASLETVLEDAS